MMKQIDFGAAASRLAEIPHRALILWGENDPWVPVDHGRRLAEPDEGPALPDRPVRYSTRLRRRTSQEEGPVA